MGGTIATIARNVLPLSLLPNNLLPAPLLLPPADGGGGGADGVVSFSVVFKEPRLKASTLRKKLAAIGGAGAGCKMLLHGERQLWGAE